MSPVVSPPRWLVNAANRRMITAPNPLFAALAARADVASSHPGWMSCCLFIAHPYARWRGPSPSGQEPFPDPLPLLRFAASGDPARFVVCCAHWKTLLPRRRRGWGALPPKSTRAWARCIAVALLRFRLPHAFVAERSSPCNRHILCLITRHHISLLRLSMGSIGLKLKLFLKKSKTT
jgi:hypothetical protein